jgi:hypothetical protein
MVVMERVREKSSRRFGPPKTRYPSLLSCSAIYSSLYAVRMCVCRPGDLHIEIYRKLQYYYAQYSWIPCTVPAQARDLTRSLPSFLPLCIYLCDMQLCMSNPTSL